MWLVNRPRRQPLGHTVPVTTTPRRLVVMRHARAEHTADSDMSRVLTPEGRADAAEAGRWLAAQDVTPDHALVSSAERTRQTWEAMRTAAGWQLSAEPDSGLYSAGPESALDVVRLVPPETSTLVVVGHNPTMSMLVQLLDDGEGDPAVLVELAGGFPTCALTVLTVGVEWAALSEAGATAEAFHVGRG